MFDAIIIAPTSLAIVRESFYLTSYECAYLINYYFPLYVRSINNCYHGNAFCFVCRYLKAMKYSI